MSDLTIGLLSALLATNQSQAVSNLVQEQTGVAVTVPDTNDPEEAGLQQLMIADDAALDEINSWISTNSISQTNTVAMKELNGRIHTRLDVVKNGYQVFLRDHPQSAHGYLAYGSFLNDIGDEDGAQVQFENSKKLDPKNPAVWNNLANYYGENGELTNAFADYTEAIRLNPAEPVYYQNFATTVYLYRKDAKEFYHINEGQVFDKALDLYRQAMALDPTNLVLATDYADSYYGIRPLRTNDALVAWSNALTIARSDVEREGIYVHLARVQIAAGFYDQAQAHLDAITNAVYVDMKLRLERSLEIHKNPPPPETNQVATAVAIGTNAIAATALTNSVTVLTNNVAALTNSIVASTNEVAPLTNSAEVLTNLMSQPDLPAPKLK